MSPRYSTGDPDLDRRLNELIDSLDVTGDRDQLFESLVSLVLLAEDHTDRLNLKITNAALKEMRLAFKVFDPYHDVPKVTIFGSARTLPDDPLYAQTRDLASALAEAGWMVVTGAGPGIMAAGIEGAGPRSDGVPAPLYGRPTMRPVVPPLLRRLSSDEYTPLPLRTADRRARSVAPAPK